MRTYTGDQPAENPSNWSPADRPVPAAPLASEWIGDSGHRQEPAAGTDRLDHRSVARTAARGGIFGIGKEVGSHAVRWLWDQFGPDQSQRGLLLLKGDIRTPGRLHRPGVHPIFGASERFRLAFDSRSADYSIYENHEEILTFALRPRSGFTELDVPYTQPGQSGQHSIEPNRPLHLLYKPFGRVYASPEIPVSEFLTSISEIYRAVYDISDPRSCEAFARLEHVLSGRLVVPLKNPT